MGARVDLVIVDLGNCRFIVKLIIKSTIEDYQIEDCREPEVVGSRQSAVGSRQPAVGSPSRQSQSAVRSRVITKFATGTAVWRLVTVKSDNCRSGSCRFTWNCLIDRQSTITKSTISTRAWGGAPAHPSSGFNPALRPYERLGFRQIEDRGVYLFMEWRRRVTPKSGCSRSEAQASLREPVRVPTTSSGARRVRP